MSKKHTYSGEPGLGSKDRSPTTSHGYRAYQDYGISDPLPASETTERRRKKMPDNENEVADAIQVPDAELEKDNGYRTPSESTDSTLSRRK